jgi:hypothetical protein
MPEIISKVEVLESGEILIALASAGKAAYQHVYRAAAGVYWQNDLGGFVSSGRSDWSAAKWFAHIVEICKDEAGVELKLQDEVEWVGVSAEDRADILAHMS